MDLQMTNHIAMFITTIAKLNSIILTMVLYFTIDSTDYNSISTEIIFTSGQTINDIQCTHITIMDDSNVLEDTESFQITLSAMDPFVIFPSTQDSIDININEDPQDGSFIYSYLLSCGSQPTRCMDIIILLL